MINDVNKRQINWDALYKRSNYGSYDVVENANGIQGNTVAGKRSHYIVVRQDRKHILKYNFNSVLNSVVS